MKRLVEEGLSPSKIMTAEAFRNAITVLHTMGGSTNGFLHLPAIASELDIPIPIDLFDELSEKTPQTCAVKPNGLRAINSIDEAGGIPAVMKNVSSLLDLEVMTVSGTSLRHILDDAVIKEPAIIRPMDDPVRPNGGLAVLRGNLAPDGAIVKKSAVPEAMFSFRGPARVFECEEDAIHRMFSGGVTPGECVIIRNEGPRGGPGMREMAIPAHLLQLLGLGESSALVTDGRYSGTNYGMCVGHVSPEAAEGGALAVVRDGDTIEIDIHQRRIRLDIPDDELEERLAAWQAPQPRHRKGVLSWYSRNVTSGDKGAVLRPGRR
jgi:dihydroxy-acid dehydratase